MIVAWSSRAEDDIDAIYKRLEEFSLSAARDQLRAIRSRATQLAQFPDSGRKMPEFDNPLIRELIEGDYRIIYERFPDRVEIISVAHGAQSFLHRTD